MRRVSLLKANLTVAFLAPEGDRIPTEHYFQGHNQTTPATIFSASKSSPSLLTGMTVDDVLIRSVQ